MLVIIHRFVVPHDLDIGHLILSELPTGLRRGLDEVKARLQITCNTLLCLLSNWDSVPKILKGSEKASFCFQTFCTNPACSRKCPSILGTKSMWMLIWSLGLSPMRFQIWIWELNNVHYCRCDGWMLVTSMILTIRLFTVFDSGYLLVINFILPSLSSI